MNRIQMINRRNFLGLAGASILGVGFSGCERDFFNKTSTCSGSGKKPNIVIFLVDDMGVMDTSVPMLTDEDGKPKRYPLNDWYRTPGMERLAKQGVRFSNFYSHNVCSPTRISIMTGHNAARHRCTDYIDPGRKNRYDWLPLHKSKYSKQVPPDWNWAGLSKRDTTLPKLLKQVGYKTIHVGKAHFAPARHEGADPRNLGFDVNIAGYASSPASYYGEAAYGVGVGDPVPGLDKYHGSDVFLTEALTLEAKAEIDKVVKEDKPFFLYMSHYAAHAPFNTDRRFIKDYLGGIGRSRPLMQGFGTMVAGADKSLGDLMDHLEAKGVAEDTLIIFLGDNGSVAPRGMRDEINACAPLRCRKGSKWEGGIRVPFIAAWAKPNPDNKWQKKMPIAINTIRPEVGTCLDLLPTVTLLAGATVPENYTLDGQDLATLFAGQSKPEHRNEFLNHYPHPRNGQSNFYTVLRKDDWKVRYDYFATKEDRYGLYNLAEDMSESNNLAKSNPEKLRSMLQEMVRQLDSMDALYPVRDGKIFKVEIP